MGAAYDSVTNPTLPGTTGEYHPSVGYGQGVGGGVITLNIANQLTLDGVLVADGSSGTVAGAGGSGGSVLVRTGTLRGVGNITANGGVGSTWSWYSGGGGGGGRIAVYLQYNDSYTGFLSAHGGAYSTISGGPGISLPRPFVVLFYFILFCFILFYYFVFCVILFYYVLFCFIFIFVSFSFSFHFIFISFHFHFIFIFIFISFSFSFHFHFHFIFIFISFSFHFHFIFISFHFHFIFISFVMYIF
jgi:hypothetical protein